MLCSVQYNLKKAECVYRLMCSPSWCRAGKGGYIHIHMGGIENECSHPRAKSLRTEKKCLHLRDETKLKKIGNTFYLYLDIL